jgi:hypothetical protein
LLGVALLLAACGIEDYIYFYPVTQYINRPSTVDKALNYWSFKTRDVDNVDGENADYFKGFEVYYKIYTSPSTLSSDVSAIDSNNENNPSTSYSYLINTKGYERMSSVSRVGKYPLIAAGTTNRVVTIRLTDYSNLTAGIMVDGESLGQALRTLDDISVASSDYYFEYDEIDASDSSTTCDSDVKYTAWATSDAKNCYVQAYVMAYGYDSNYKRIYSVPFNIGYVTVYVTD